MLHAEALAEQLDTLNFLWTFTRSMPVTEIDKKTSAFIAVQRESSFFTPFSAKSEQQLRETGVHKSISLMCIYIDFWKNIKISKILKI